jgi:hypothetical protein
MIAKMPMAARESATAPRIASSLETATLVTEEETEHPFDAGKLMDNPY